MAIVINPTKHALKHLRQHGVFAALARFVQRLLLHLVHLTRVSLRSRK